MEQIKTRAQKIKLVIFDVDGVLTDGRLFYGDDGQEYKAFQSRDGHGMKMLQKSGVEIALITGRTSEVVNHRAKNLGIQHVYQGQLQKLPAFNALLERLKFTADEVAYVGDDVVDLPVMLRVGLAITVSDGHELAKKHAHLITQQAGGQGAAREICEFIMRAQGTWDNLIQEYIS